MFKALILICHVSVTPPDCNQITAQDVIQGPKAPSGHGCLFQGMAYTAEAGFRLDRQHYAKIVCTRGS